MTIIARELRRCMAHLRARTNNRYSEVQSLDVETPIPTYLWYTCN
jgi:hypothetical protein